MMASLRSATDYALRRSPVQALFRRRAAGRLAVLAYHGVADRQNFGRQLDHLVRVAQPVSVDDVIAAVHDGAALPPRAILVTFDDGHRSVLENAVPELAHRGVPAVAFVIAGLCDTDRPFWWSEVEQLVTAGARMDAVPVSAGEAPASSQTHHLGPRPPADLVVDDPHAWVRWLKTVDDEVRREVIGRLRGAAPQPAAPMPQLRAEELPRLETAGVRVGSHTLTHPCLDRCDDPTVRREIHDAHAVLAAALGRPPVAFAYPNGNGDARAERELHHLGYRLGFLFDHRLTDVTAMAPLRLSRLRVSDTTPIDRFATIVSGLHPAVHHALGRP